MLMTVQIANQNSQSRRYYRC